MRIVFALLPGLFLSALLHAQSATCTACTKAETGRLPLSRVACLSQKQLAAHIGSQRPVRPPGLNEPHIQIEGTVVACLCFSRTGEVTQVNIVSGPAMMQQSVLESLKNWTFRPLHRGGRRYGGCGTLRIHVVLKDSQVQTTIEE